MPLLFGVTASSGGSGSTVSGGFLYSDSGYYYSVFLGGTSTFTVGVAPLNVDLITIAGGGGAGTAAGGGGGAGGVVIRSGMLTVGSYTAVVGTGGAGATSDGSAGGSGANSTFDTITAYGGGGGAHNSLGLTGGSGGGGGYSNGNNGGATNQTSNGSGIGYGFAGGGNSRTGSGTPYPCGGGGGAGGAGTAVSGTTGGPGGIGITNALINSIAAATGIGELSGGNYYLAGGGGGSRDVTIVAGGLGGGGKGGTIVTPSANVATDGLDNYGAGGGGGDVDGGGFPPVRAGRGGDGLIVVRYAKGDVVAAPTNSYTTSGLLFNYDASNTSSYPGSGTTWTDLANARNVELTNTTYSSSNGGGIVFNGSNSYGYASLGNLGGTYTIEIALKYASWNEQGSDALTLTSSAANNHGLVIETNYSGSTSSGTNTIRYLHRMPYGGGAADDDISSTSALSLNTNYVITIVRIQGQRQQMYFNGVKVRSDWYTTNAGFDAGLNQLNLGRLIAITNARLLNGTIYSLRGYTRALPPEEIKANFNAIKTRLGI